MLCNCDAYLTIKHTDIESIRAGSKDGTINITLESDPDNPVIACAYDEYDLRSEPPVPSFSGEFAEVAAMIDYYLPDFRKSLRINVLNQMVVGESSLWGQEKGLKPIVEGNGISDETDAWEMVQNKLPKYKFESSGRSRSIKLPIDHFRRYIRSRGSHNEPYNPFKDEWTRPPDYTMPNSIERYDPRTYLKRCGARSPIPDMDPDENDTLVNGLSELIFSTIIGRTADTEKGNGFLFLMLYGVPGSGKSSIAQHLAFGTDLNPGPYFKNMTSYPKDELALYYATRGKVIVELEEGCGLEDFNRLKGDVTRSSFDITEKWEVFNIPKKKTYTEIGTSNHYLLIPEDNRRVATLEVVAPEDESCHAYNFPLDVVRCMYYNAYHGNPSLKDFKGYVEGRTGHEIYKEIRSLVDKTRKVVLQIPDSVQGIMNFADEYVKSWTGINYIANVEIKDYLWRNDFDRDDIKDGLKWLADGGFKDLGWDTIRMSTTPHQNSYAVQVMGRASWKKMGFNYRVRNDNQ